MSKSSAKARIKELEAESDELRRYVEKMSSELRLVRRRSEEQVREIRWKLDAARRVLSDDERNERAKW